MRYKQIIIYGGTSEISLELIDIYLKECERIIIFCRVEQNFIELLKKKKNYNELINKIKIFEADILDLNKNLEIVKGLNDSISGVIWVAGFTGDAEYEYNNINEAEKNIKINFLNPSLVLTEISKKIIKNNNSFIAAFASVAGLRGRKKQFYYSPSKSGLIAFLSALRQKLFKDQITVTTVIPGYMNTKPFRNGKWNSPRFLVAHPKNVASNLKKAIDNKKDVIYINYFWRLIMIIIKFLPEKIFKRFSF
tara:strand:+ start:404 stop:1153 length:750 start_codon:yes stop_codon:yes gene_type:complete